MASDEAKHVPQIKGIAMLNCVRALRSMDKEKARSVVPAYLHKYLEDERILAVAWYPESEMLELNRALAQLIRPTLRGATMDQTYVHMGYLVCNIDLAGMYASLARGGLSADSVQRMAASWKHYHDTGTLEGVLGDNNQARFELRDYGLPNREVCLIERGWLTAYFERTTGSTEVTVVESQCRLRGGRTCVWDASWAPAKPDKQ